jgi:hypothetical protein
MTVLRVVFRISVHACCVIQVLYQSVSYYFYSITFCYIMCFLSFLIANSTFINKPILYVVYLGTAIQSVFLSTTSYKYFKFPFSVQ